MHRRIPILHTQLFINNEFVDAVSKKTLDVINPTTGEVITEVSEADAADVDLAVAAARAAFKRDSPWRTCDASERGAAIHRLADLIVEEKEYFADLEALDAGKPRAEAEFDVECTIATFRYYAGWSDKIHGKTIPADGGVISMTRHEPIGVCGLIIPWNYPILMAAWKLAPALAAGNCCVLKPSENTPLSALVLGKLIKAAGFPPGVVNIVPGYGPTAGRAIAMHDDIDKIAFTGSTKVGRLIQSASGESNLKRVTLELGGKSPLVIFGDVDLDEAVEIAHNAVFANMGQCCCAGTRTYVHEGIYDAFVEKAKALAEKRKVGDPFDPEVVQGPQISALQAERIMELVESGKKEGAKCVAGGKRAPGEGFFIEPTVFADVTDNMRIAREEIFGPVQQILKFSTMDEVIDRSNDTRYGLGAGILTKDIDRALEFAQGVQSGSVWINCYDASTVQTPFGGYKQSGHGRELGYAGINEYVETKTITIKVAKKHS
ncbi:aldehyde dehydrogenase X, mitochondrial [Galendromus occidentalis]|uniref:Aldehyde dehydrogenase X, mitochondrial n=1 Tax=Galendromus occidentalis TaxID=34638 RepID=A0AAJ6QQP5_9ACAR|nr:aldehyde dehydrogenase X, mitochondrial [Galendromus occidentalis]